MKKIRKLMVALAMAIFAFGIMNMAVLKTQAASSSAKKTMTYYLYDNTTINYFVYGDRVVPGAKATNLKNDNPAVVKAYLDKEYGSGAVVLTPRKPGISKISYRYDGKTYVQKIKVVKYENPCKSFKVGNTDHAKWFKKTRHFNQKNVKQDITATINIKPKKGWKLKKIGLKDMFSGTKKVKNHSKITLKRGRTTIYAYFKNVKTGFVQELIFNYSSGNYAMQIIHD